MADGQDTAAQVAALRAAGCERVYEDPMSGARWDRPETCSRSIDSGFRSSRRVEIAAG